MIARLGKDAIEPRGAVSAALLRRLASPPTGSIRPDRLGRLAGATGWIDEDDLQLSLWVLHELHYRGLDGVDDHWEWDPELLGLARSLEAELELDLRASVGHRVRDALDTRELADALTHVISADGPSLSYHLARTSTLEQFCEFVIHRSLYHLKEADPHSWVIPRVAGSAKAALVEIQSDEYGGGRPERMHAHLFAKTMRGLGLDDRYGGYLNDVPAVTLRWANTMSLFGLHRRLRGAAIGHLAALEMTSSQPNRRYGNGLRRLGLDPETTDFFDEHVEADAVHEQIAVHDLALGLIRDEPALAVDVVFGAAAAVQTDAAVAEHLLTSWAEGRSSLRTRSDDPAAGGGDRLLDSVRS